MAGPIALTPSRDCVALATTDAPDANKTPTFDIGDKDVLEDQEVNDRMYVYSCGLSLRYITDVASQYRAQCHQVPSPPSARRAPQSDLRLRF